MGVCGKLLELLFARPNTQLHFYRRDPMGLTFPHWALLPMKGKKKGDRQSIDWVPLFNLVFNLLRAYHDWFK